MDGVAYMPVIQPFPWNSISPNRAWCCCLPHPPQQLFSSISTWQKPGLIVQPWQNRGIQVGHFEWSRLARSQTSPSKDAHRREQLQRSSHTHARARFQISGGLRYSGGEDRFCSTSCLRKACQTSQKAEVRGTGEALAVRRACTCQMGGR